MTEENIIGFGPNLSRISSYVHKEYLRDLLHSMNNCSCQTRQNRYLDENNVILNFFEGEKRNYAYILRVCLAPTERRRQSFRESEHRR